jgi:hypothetical protein
MKKEPAYKTMNRVVRSIARLSDRVARLTYAVEDLKNAGPERQEIARLRAWIAHIEVGGQSQHARKSAGDALRERSGFPPQHGEAAQ